MSKYTRNISSIPTIALTLALGLFSAACSEQQSKAAEGSADRAPAAAASQPGTPSAQPGAGQAVSPQAAGYEGFIDEVTCQLVRGWAWDSARPNEPLSIELYDGDRLLKTVVADQLRPDLVDGGKGNGRHVFREATPPELKDGKVHTVRAVVKGANYELKPSAGMSAVVTCAPSGT
jgi:hypothetical protein